jgi:hypothetical protein
MTKRVREDGIPTCFELAIEMQAFERDYFRKLCKALGEEEKTQNLLELLKNYNEEVQTHGDNITDEIQRRMGESLEKLRKILKSE